MAIHRARSTIGATSGNGSARVQRLVVAPHADDEALGCGGILAKYQSTCAVVVLARPDQVRLAELNAARHVLGYRDTYLLDLPDGHIGSDMHTLVGLLDETLNLCRPTELYLPFPSLHQDHVAAYEAGMRSARLSMTQGHWFPPSVYVYDVAAYDLTLYPTSLRWNVFEALDESAIDRKVQAVQAYISQRVVGPHPVNGIKQSAQAIGAARQVPWAEQFALVRTVREADGRVRNGAQHEALPKITLPQRQREGR